MLNVLRFWIYRKFTLKCLIRANFSRQKSGPHKKCTNRFNKKISNHPLSSLRNGLCLFIILLLSTFLTQFISLTINHISAHLFLLMHDHSLILLSLQSFNYAYALTVADYRSMNCIPCNSLTFIKNSSHTPVKVSWRVSNIRFYPKLWPFVFSVSLIIAEHVHTFALAWPTSDVLQNASRGFQWNNAL